MKIAFLGLPLAALLLRSDGHEIVYAGVCRKDALGVRRLKRALGPRVVLVPDLASKAAAARIAASAPDLLVSWFWTKRVPRAVLDVAPLGAVGVHPSLLPRHRGPDPYFWAVRQGDAETGVTAHRLAEEYDTGAVLAARRLALDPAWNAWTLAKRLDRPSLALLREVVASFARGAPPPDTKQDERDATLAPAPSDDDLEIRWHEQDAEEVVRLVRAASPWPSAFTDIAGETVAITQAKVASSFPRVLLPGEAAVVDTPAPHVVVRAKDGAVELCAGRLDAGEDAELTPEDFVRLVRADPVSS